MADRFGTPTPRAGSGTEEEFNRVYSRHQSDSTSVEIMFYFKSIAPSLYDLDLEQFSRVKKFRDQLASKGLFRDYKDADEFERLVRQHLTLVRTKLSGRSASHKAPLLTDDVSATVTRSKERSDQVSESEMGFLDWQLELEDELDNATKAMEVIGGVHSEITAQMSEKLKQVSGATDTRTKKGLFDSISSDIENCAIRVDAETSVLSSSLSKVFRAFERAMSMVAELKSEEIDSQRKALLEVLESAKGPMDSFAAQTKSLAATISNMPAITAKLSRASSTLRKAEERLAREIEIGSNLFEQAVTQMKS